MPGYANSSGQMDIADYYRMLERRVARLERGTTGAPSTDVVVIGSLAISGLALTTQTVNVDLDGYFVMMRFNWTAVPNDPSEYNKDALDGYLTSYSLDGTHWTADLFTTDTFIDVGRFAQGKTVTFRVRARTVKGTLGAYSSISQTTTADSTAPFQPSTPVVSPYLGQLAIDWNGLDVSSNPMPTDFNFCEVHLSTSSATFTPTTATLVGTILLGGGTWVATGLTYGTLQYARLVAVDTVGNRSVSSTAGSGTPVQAANGDISSLAVGKLTAGVITAIMTITGRLATSLTGARVEMNVNGIQAFNSSSQQTVDVAAATGAVTITGTLKTGFTGVRMVIDSSLANFIQFYPSTGSNYAYISANEDAGNSAYLFAQTGSFTYNSVSTKHRLYLSNASGIYLHSILTSTGLNNGGFFNLNAGNLELSMYGSTGTRTGGYLSMDTGAIELSVRGSSGNHRGGYLFMDTGASQYSVFNSSAVQDGGFVDLDTTFSKIKVTNTGTVAAELALFDDQSWWMSGKVSSSNAIGGFACVFVDTWSVTAGTNVVSFGVTMDSTPWPVCTLVNGGGPWKLSVTAASTTAFTMLTDATGTVRFNYWCFRRL